MNERKAVVEETEEAGRQRLHHTDISSLPDDVLIEVFSMLDIGDLCRVEQVCARWLSNARVAWSLKRCLNIKRRRNNVNKNTPRMTENDGDDEKYQALQRRNEKFLNDLVVSKSLGSSLVRIDLSQCVPLHYVRGVWLSALGAQCPNLVHVNLSHLDVSASALIALVVGVGGGGCGPRLRELIVAHNSQLDDTGLTRVLARCLVLEHLDIRGCVRITGECLNLSSNLTRLRRLVLYGCKRIWDTELKAILTANRSLEQLAMDANGVAHETFAHMLATLTQLNSLELIGWRIGNDARSERSIEQLPDLFAHLTRIEIKDAPCGDECDTRLVRMLLERAPRLRCLIMNDCARVDDAAFDKVRISAPIEHLALNNFKKKISDATLETICEQLSGTLHTLELSACHGLTCAAICRAIGELTSLRMLNVGHIEHVDNSVLEAALAALAVASSKRRPSMEIVCVNTSVDTRLFTYWHKGTEVVRRVDGDGETRVRTRCRFGNLTFESMPRIMPNF